MKPDKPAAAAAIDAFLRALGLDVDAHPELRGTGSRVASAFADELCAGYTKDTAALLRENILVTSASGPICVRDVDVTTMCPHHLLLATGKATVAFQPRAHLLGLGALPELVQALAARLVLQEALTEDIAEALWSALQPEWVLCKTRMVHGCMHARGPRAQGTSVDVVAQRGTPPDVWLVELLRA
jgi:GTP cyclohydrolase IA